MQRMPDYYCLSDQEFLSLDLFGLNGLQQWTKFAFPDGYKTVLVFYHNQAKVFFGKPAFSINNPTISTLLSLSFLPPLM